MKGNEIVLLNSLLPYARIRPDSMANINLQERKNIASKTLVTSDQKFEFYASLVAMDGVGDFVRSVMPRKVEYQR